MHSCWGCPTKGGRWPFHKRNNLSVKQSLTDDHEVYAWKFRAEGNNNARWPRNTTYADMLSAGELPDSNTQLEHHVIFISVPYFHTAVGSQFVLGPEA